MSRPRQYTLAIDLPLEQRLDNFVPGRNAELLAVLTAQNASFQGVWLFGGHGSGRSHLLKGACLQAQERGEQAVYIACAQYAEDPDRLVSQLQSASQGGPAAAILTAPPPDVLLSHPLAVFCLLPPILHRFLPYCLHQQCQSHLNLTLTLIAVQTPKTSSKERAPINTVS